MHLISIHAIFVKGKPKWWFIKIAFNIFLIDCVSELWFITKSSNQSSVGKSKFDYKWKSGEENGNETIDWNHWTTIFLPPVIYRFIYWHISWRKIYYRIISCVITTINERLSIWISINNFRENSLRVSFCGKRFVRIIMWIIELLILLHITNYLEHVKASEPLSKIELSQ